MPDEAQQRAVRIKDLTHTRSEEFRFVYANSATVSETFWDITLIFGEVIPSPGQNTAVVEDRVGVTMSWEHAKALCEVFKRQVDDYERKFGPLRNPNKPPIEDSVVPGRTG
jgi:hypothetical protein